MKFIVFRIAQVVDGQFKLQRGVTNNQRNIDCLQRMTQDQENVIEKTSYFIFNQLKVPDLIQACHFKELIDARTEYHADFIYDLRDFEELIEDEYKEYYLSTYPIDEIQKNEINHVAQLKLMIETPTKIVLATMSYPRNLQYYIQL